MLGFISNMINHKKEDTKIVINEDTEYIAFKNDRIPSAFLVLGEKMISNSKSWNDGYGDYLKVTYSSFSKLDAYIYATNLVIGNYVTIEDKNDNVILAIESIDSDYILTVDVKILNNDIVEIIYSKKKGNIERENNE